MLPTKVLIAALVIAASTPGQHQFVPLDASRFPSVPGTRNLAVGDFNKDGFPDVVFVSEATAQPHELFLNTGDGRFRSASHWIPRATAKALAIAVGDVNGDGYDDILVGAYFNDAAATDAGSAYVFFGGPAADTVADLTLTGEAAGDTFGLSVSSAGDINGDGYADVLVGA